MKFARKVRRAQLARTALTDALSRGCTCSNPQVEVLGVGGAVSRVAVGHDPGCPAAGSESVVVLPREGEG